MYENFFMEMKDMDIVNCECGRGNAIFKYTFYFRNRCIFNDFLFSSFFGDRKGCQV